MIRLKQLPFRNELIVLLLIISSIQLFKKDVPSGIYAAGIANGAQLALYSVGLILVFRANRIINFAQIALGSTAATLFAVSSTYRPALRWLSSAGVCSRGCDGSTAVAINYWVSMAMSLALAIGLGWLTHILVVRRFAQAPRLVLTVATVFVALFLELIKLHIPELLTTSQERKDNLQKITHGSPLPFHYSIHFKAFILGPSAITMIVVAAIALTGLGLFLRRGVLGVAIRATADAPSRAATLGLDVGSVDSRVWMISASLSGLASVIGATYPGDPRVGGLALEVLVLILTVAVIARFVSLAMAAAASLVLGVLASSVFWSYSSIAPFYGALFFVISTVLLLQPRTASRGEIEAASSWSDTRELRPIPQELRDLPTVRNWIVSLSLLATILMLGLPFVLSPSQSSQATAYLVYAMVGVSLLVLTGWAGQISLGQYGFVAIGAYVVAQSHLPFLIAVPAAGVGGLVVAVLVGIPGLKLRGLHLAITSLAFALAVSTLLLNPQYLGKGLGKGLSRPSVVGISLNNDRGFYYLTLGILVLIVGGVMGLRRSRIARVLIAARDNERAAQSLGIDITRARLVAFGVSGFIAGVAGAILAYQQGGVQAGSYDLEQGVHVFQDTVIGGLGSISGPLIGAVYRGLPQILGLPTLVGQLTSGGLGLVILLVVPGGIGRVIYDVRDAMLRRLASRQRIIVPSLLADTGEQLDGAIVLPANVETGGRAVYVPRRYRIPKQWALNGHEEIDTKELLR